MKHVVAGLVGCIFVLALTGCTRVYKPVSKWEKSVYAQARKDVYPDDVRYGDARDQEDLLVWPGILKKADLREQGDTIWMSLTVEHHYYDWLEDSSMRKYWLSPRGEGIFTVAWSVPIDWGLEECRKQVRPGAMVIVYGRPKGAGGGLIRFGHAEYIRLIPKMFYGTDILDYGRHDERVDAD